MKKVVLLAVLGLLASCKNVDQKQVSERIDMNEQENVYDSFGKEIDIDNTLNIELASSNYKGLKIGDTLSFKFKGKVKEVCVKKGCWMKLDLDDGEEAMVKFKDYGFFVPKDIVGKEVIVDGNAFIEEMSVDDQKHYAKDGGEGDDEISKIVSVKRTNLFVAEGVLIEKK
ncbi:protein of unknown function [Zhouia amylolytica]|uniref:DUF4920 domain-containing protein n=1 Tax=Zhouia amylolytica TaxID=376730 RepID=A0A1I6RS96_9FLAO|nr:DUF4920 domain-containing protein [Zhouia amylolytica]SFS67597.1 protein of unknown function [Zhouia amylolytica]